MLRALYPWAAALSVGLTVVACHGINPFAADLGRTEIGGKVARAPYLSQFSYLGYLEPEAQGAASPADQESRAVYFWLPLSTPELGVRFLSGSTGKVNIDATKDITEAAFVAHQKDDSFFDPALELQRCLTALEISDVAKPCAQWVALGENDDSPEMPPNKDGKFLNSLVRVGTHPEDPLKSLTRGLYRVNVQGAKQTTPKGTFLLQLGAPVLLDAVAMARTPEALAQMLQAQHNTLGDVPTLGHTGPVVPPEGTVAPLEPPSSGGH